MFMLSFITDYMRLMVTGNMNPYEVESLWMKIATLRKSEVPATGLSAMGDSLPAFGIVAAVADYVVNALGAADRPAGEMGV